MLNKRVQYVTSKDIIDIIDEEWQDLKKIRDKKRARQKIMKKIEIIIICGQQLRR